MKATKRKPGRPKLPKGHAKGKIVPVRLSDERRKMLEKMTKASEHENMSQLIRHSLDESMRETNVHRLLSEQRQGKPFNNLSDMDVRDIRHFDGIDLEYYRSLPDQANIYGTRTTVKDIRDLQRISKGLPSE